MNMPDRILRAELLTSEAWLSCKSNDDRVCWIALIPSVDTFGNMPSGPYRLIHLWRPYGIETPEKVAKVLNELVGVDLVRTYWHPCGPAGEPTKDSKPYLHIPRFRQSRRYLGKLWPLSPWTTDEEKQRLTEKSPADHSDSHETACDSPVGVGVGVGVEVDLNLKPTPTAFAPPSASPAVKTVEQKPEVKGTRILPDLPCPDEWRDWAVQAYGITPQAAVRHFIEFRDYWADIPGRYGRKVRWFGTFKNRLRALNEKGNL